MKVRFAAEKKSKKDGGPQMVGPVKLSYAPPSFLFYNMETISPNFIIYFILRESSLCLRM